MHALLMRNQNLKRYEDGTENCQRSQPENQWMQIQTYICLIQALGSELFTPTIFFVLLDRLCSW